MIPVWDFVWELIFAIYWLGKTKKTKYFPPPILRYRNFKIWHPLKQTKSKNGRHFIISTFEKLQLCFFVQKDSDTLKVLKMQFVFGWAYDKGHCIFNLQCSLLWLSRRQIAFLGPLEWRNLFGQKTLCKVSIDKSWQWYFLLELWIVNWMCK